MALVGSNNLYVSSVGIWLGFVGILSPNIPID